MHGQVSEGGMQEGAYAVSQTLRVVARARKRCRAPAAGLRVSYHGALLWCSFDLVHGLYGFSSTFWKAPRALLRAKIAGISRPFPEGTSYAGLVLDQRQNRALAMGQSLGQGTV